ncbi:MAG: hypothetical protein J6C86_11930 [Bacteroidaceae bacterium]|nr:hypothetical protein [Bacteroidaceae bacterium]
MNFIKSKIFKTVLCTIAIAATGITAIKAYEAGSLTLPYKDSIIMENIEALSEPEGTGVDLTKYNINMREDWTPITVEGRTGCDVYIMVEGIKISVGTGFRKGDTVLYSDCVGSPGNYCEKSWVKNIQFKRP